MSEEFEFNNNNNEIFEEDADNKVSRFQVARRRKQAQLKRNVRKSKQNIKLVLFFSRLFLIIFLVCLCYLIVRLKYWKLNPHAFESLNNTSIKIENNYIVPSERILKAVKENEVPTCPIFLMKTDDIKKSILEITPIQDVYIKRFWLPARIEILVQEREPAITIAPNENVPPIAFYTKDGKLIGRAYLPLNPYFKTVKVLTYGSCSGAVKFDEAKIKFILTIAKDIEQASKEPVQYIDLRNPDDIYVQIPTVKIKLGSISAATYPDTLKKINGLPSILPKVKILNKKVKYVDLRWQNNLYYIKLAE
ncbi:MAG: FtsQ-type POTRA domain-containing protein [Candidatus Gastranaerophilales bacterium]|nr:FtsQ-type POTRA domain-containing protein [Candidatus Gastranaerophilales bacterium]